MNKINLEKKSLHIAADLHNQWRLSRKIVEGTAIDGLPKREERFKPIDPEDPNGPQVDIANTPYNKLPPVWQNENYLASLDTLENISDNNEKNSGELDLEKTSTEVHNSWQKRHPQTSGEQAASYDNLSELEKNKDRVVVEEVVKNIDEAGYDFKLVKKI